MWNRWLVTNITFNIAIKWLCEMALALSLRRDIPTLTIWVIIRSPLRRGHSIKFWSLGTPKWLWGAFGTNKICVVFLLFFYFFFFQLLGAFGAKLFLKFFHIFYPLNMQILVMGDPQMTLGGIWGQNSSLLSVTL